MRLLLINKFWHDVGRAGGVGRYIMQEAEDLQNLGWEVIPFAIADDDARPSPWDKHFPKAHDYSSPRFDLTAATSLIWNFEAARKLDALIKESKPDVAHIHNIYHHLSPSILSVLQKHNIPVVQTIHDWRLLCPAIHMLQDGKVCEKCKGGNFHHAISGKCVKGSLPASVLAAAETWLHASRKKYRNTVSKFLCPSKFLKDKHVQWGWPAEQMLHLPNFVDLEQWPQNDDRENYYLFVGRLSAEKGLKTLLAAHAELDNGLELRIAGSGPQTDELKTLAGDNVTFLGHIPLEQVKKEIGNARFSVIPSEWYENGPFSIIESLAAGTPVVGTDLGGIPEHLDEKCGILFESGNKNSLLSALQKASTLGIDANRSARNRAKTLFDRKTHMQKLSEILKSLMLVLLLITSASAAPWPAGSGNEIGHAGSSGYLPEEYETSGAVYHPVRETIITVSDGGHICEMSPDGGNATVWTLEEDLEAVTIADPSSDLIYLGVEHPDGVIEFNLATGSPTGNSWDLTDWMNGPNGNGLEALTYVDGLFYAGLQEDGKIHKFDLQPAGNVTRVGVFNSYDNLDDLSGMHYDACTDLLLAIHDNHNLLVEYNAAGQYIRSFDMPNDDQEGVAIIGGVGSTSTVIYIAQDSGELYKFDGYPIDVCEDLSSVPTTTPLQLNCYPNPFNPAITIDWESDSPARITISDSMGRTVRNLTGENHVSWNGMDNSGNSAPGGTYFVEVVVGKTSETTSISLIK
ncbi:glycosyltransferase [bacterium]|mgnify:CR=1 FL=1|nr:glycosyltransferase [bacterium]